MRGLWWRIRLVWQLARLVFCAGGGETDMAAVYVALIIKGAKAFTDVAPPLKEQVREMLVALDCAFLAE